MTYYISAKYTEGIITFIDQVNLNLFDDDYFYRQETTKWKIGFSNFNRLSVQ